MPFPVLKDFDQQAADAFGARRTPEAYLLDAGRVIRYHGRIDDQYGIDFRRDKPTRRDLKEALDELLAGRPISVPQTEASGCPIERAEGPDKTEVTYAKHVAPILQALPGMSPSGRDRTVLAADLRGREAADRPDPRGRARAADAPLACRPALRQVLQRPTLARGREGHPARLDRRGSPGDDKDLPPPRKFVTGWKIGEPEQVFAMAAEFKVPATGVLDYQRFVVDPGFEDDVWVQRAECRPGNRKVVHHILVYILAPGRRDPYDIDGTAATLVGWAPGDMPAMYPDDTARRIPAGSKLLFEVHYTPNGTEQTDRSSVGVISPGSHRRTPSR